MSTAESLSATPAADLKRYEDALHAMEACLDDALAHIKGQSAQLAPGEDLIDQHQLAVYDLAFFRAELSAAKAMQHWPRPRAAAMGPSARP